jgi:hypothetical protein
VRQALEFAKRIPRPKILPVSGSVEGTKAEGGREREEGEMFSARESGMVEGGCSRIRELEAEHENARAEVAAIRKAFGCLLNGR